MKTRFSFTQQKESLEDMDCICIPKAEIWSPGVISMKIDKTDFYAEIRAGFCHKCRGVTAVDYDDLDRAMEKCVEYKNKITQCGAW